MKPAIFLFFLLASINSFASQVLVAVAANFAPPMKIIAADFEKATGHRVVASYGSTGALFAQIKSGAPFEVFLSADSETPARLDNEGDAVAGSRFTYAIGKLVLWSRQPGAVDEAGAVLRRNEFNRLALANPKLAPYGAAAVEALKSLGMYEAVKPKFVTATNITQSLQFVKSGNAELGFIALSQVWENGRFTEGSGWIVPQSLYSTIHQDAVLLNRGRDNPAAVALLNYLRSERARAVIRNFGYDL